jgi:hypothetical protein
MKKFDHVDARLILTRTPKPKKSHSKIKVSPSQKPGLKINFLDAKPPPSPRPQLGVNCVTICVNAEAPARRLLGEVGADAKLPSMSVSFFLGLMNNSPLNLTSTLNCQISYGESWTETETVSPVLKKFIGWLRT